MARLEALADTLDMLYLRSGNVCAFPGCDHPIFDDDNNYIAQLCHIKAASPGGERYDPAQSDEERRSYENLLFLCNRHHTITDNVVDFPVVKMVAMKRDHELKFTEAGRRLTTQMITKIQIETEFFWKWQSEKEFPFDDLKIKVDTDKSFVELFEELEEFLNRLAEEHGTLAESDSNAVLRKDLQSLFIKAGLDFASIEKIAYTENPFILRNVESHRLTIPNFYSHISLSLKQLKVKFIEELRKNNPQDSRLDELVKKWRNEFDSDYGRTYYAD